MRTVYEAHTMPKIKTLEDYIVEMCACMKVTSPLSLSFLKVLSVTNYLH